MGTRAVFGDVGHAGFDVLPDVDVIHEVVPWDSGGEGLHHLQRLCFDFGVFCSGCDHDTIARHNPEGRASFQSFGLARRKAGAEQSRRTIEQMYFAVYICRATIYSTGMYN